MIDTGIAGVVLLVMALTTTFGLSYGIAGSLHAGRLQLFRNEENVIRYLTILAVSIFDVMAIWPLVQFESPINTILVVTSAGMGAIASWKMFTAGSSRGEMLFGYDLRDTIQQVHKTLDSISETSTNIRDDHRQDSEKIHQSIAHVAEKLELDQKIKDYASDSARNEAENAVDDYRLQIQEYGERFLDKLETEHNNLSNLLYMKLDKIFANMIDTVNSSLLGELTDEAQNNESQKNKQVPTSTIVSEPSNIKQSQNVLNMISLDLSQYRPKAHKLCIAIHNLVQNRQNTISMPAVQYRPNLSEISGISGVNKADVKSRLQELANFGLVTMQKGQSRIEFGLSEKLDRLFNPVLENQREGGMESFYLIQKAKKHYLDNTSYFEVLKQDISIQQPDAIMIPVLDNESFSVSKSIAIEIETQQEIRSHPEQVRSNMEKNLQHFSRVEVWCYAENCDAIQKISESLDLEKRLRIGIMPVQRDGSLA